MRRRAERDAARYAERLEQLGLMAPGAAFASEPAAAILLGVDTKSLRRWRRDQTGPPHRMIGPRVGYDLVELALWTTRRRTNADNQALDDLDEGVDDVRSRRRCTK